MFGRIGRFTASHARTVLVLTALLMVGAAALGITAFGKLQTEGFDDPNSDSSQAMALIDSQFGGENDVVFLFSAHGGAVDAPAVRQAAADLTDRMAADPGITGFTSYFTTKAPPMRSEDGQYAIGVAQLTDEGHVKALRADYGGDDGPIRVQVGGPDAIGVDISNQVAGDLAVAEMIAVPIIMVLLVIVFGSVI